MAVSEKRAIVKLTDTNGCTKGRTQWGPGVTHTVPEWGGVLCATGVLHCYEAATLRDALALAILRNPADGLFGPTARAWVCEGAGQVVTNGLKSGYETLTTVREIALPTVTTEQRAECAIRIAWEVCDDPVWRAWAQAWLDGTDRSRDAARAAAAKAVDAAAKAVDAATWAVDAAAWAAVAAVDAAWAAAWAVDAAGAAAAGGSIDVAAIAGAILLPEWVDNKEAGQRE